MQITTLQAVQYAIARRTMRERKALLPFPTGHTLRKLDGLMQPHLVAYDGTLAEIRESFKDDPESEKKVSAALVPILEAPLTVECEKVHASGFGSVELTDDEQIGLSPFIE